MQRLVRGAMLVAGIVSALVVAGCDWEEQVGDTVGLAFDIVNVWL